MGPLQKLLLIILLVSFITFVALFGRLPALRNTPIGFAHRVIWIHAPGTLRNADRNLTDGRLTASAARMGRYLMYDQHPVVLIFFLTLLTAASCLFLSDAWSRLPSHHRYLIPVFLFPPYLFTYACVTSTASNISPANHHSHMRVYPYDYVLYQPGIRCRTCLFQKPARSKHCSVCKTCVARHDHHCIWVNNCVGRHNYIWFLGLLLSLGMLLSYGAGLAYILISPRVPPKPPGLRALINAWGIATAQDAKIGSAGLLALLTAPLAWGLFGYHVYLIWAGVTTNETDKWDEWRLNMADGLVFKGQRTKRGLEPPTPWPVSSTQVLVMTTDGKPPVFSQNAQQNCIAGHDAIDWQRCWRLADVVNLYDLGFWDNLKDVLNIL